MSEQKPDYRLSHPGQMIALGCLAFSALVFLMGQLRTGTLERGMLRGQAANYAQRGEEMEKTLQEARKAVESRATQIKKAEADESRYAALLDELMELSKEDPEARLITQKWRMQQQNPTPRAPGGSPSESAPPAVEPQAATSGSRGVPGSKAGAPRKNTQGAPSPQSLLSEPLLPR